ncbi:DUF262 domain-containing protein [Ramlibacter sp. G-1-2-2]|uniref:DUF262 domain-containing protein n=1 Tax=Ramlibacter agri TaxID=2728837 RepID=A0A848GYX1_9BURK|nr:DUF262 domain-containing protein [Ramlibacter agri]NML42499.1 DUF262 domain-containing protein [Ramlibacter agri]
MIESKLFSLAKLAAQVPQWQFSVPIYQRLYVWGEDQVRTLLEDLCNAYARRDQLFFLGGTLLVEQESMQGRQFDLVDGQQRFTTLWLLSHAWRHALEGFLRVRHGEHVESRLRFAIRPEVNAFMESLAVNLEGRTLVDAEGTGRMRAALALMQSVFQNQVDKRAASAEDFLAGITEFVFERVQFVITAVPRETDLNKLFEVINNRGVQLQHHEILKARMLDALTEAERPAFVALWDACADMEDYVEDNLCGVSRLQKRDVTALHVAGRLDDAAAVRAALLLGPEGEGPGRAYTLQEILEDSGQDDVRGASGAGDQEQRATGVRSIFGFPLFLQHVLRIWLHERGLEDLPRVLDRELLALFGERFLALEDRASNVRSFIDLLWRLRVLFDRHFIKWVDQGEEEVHLIGRISVSETRGVQYMSRSREDDSHRELSMLQSMLYHSQEITTQYWVTPLLLFIHRDTGQGAAEYFRYLRHLDNHLLGSDAQESLASRTRLFMVEPWRKYRLVHREVLAQRLGVRFPHYWFYKLEFVLWFQRARQDERWGRFRMTAKNSVEHISPQTPTTWDHNRVTKDSLDAFGNLALVSRSVNSEYSNMPYDEKRTRFRNRNRTRLDSLKMELIYANDQWNDERASAHQQGMVDKLDAYCNGATEAA